MNIVYHRLLWPECLQCQSQWNQLDVMEMIYVGLLGQRGSKCQSDPLDSPSLPDPLIPTGHLNQ